MSQLETTGEIKPGTQADRARHDTVDMGAKVAVSYAEVALKLVDLKNVSIRRTDGGSSVTYEVRDPVFDGSITSAPGRTEATMNFRNRQLQVPQSVFELLDSRLGNAAATQPASAQLTTNWRRTSFGPEIPQIGESLRKLRAD